MRLLDAQWLWWSAVFVAAVLLSLVGAVVSRRLFRRAFGGDTAHAAFAGVSDRRSMNAQWRAMPARIGPRVVPLVLRSAVLALAGACVLLALARPAYDPRPTPGQRSGRDVVFVIDVSRSMLAQDLKPSRLERAKLAVSDAIEAARGERIGIIAFAGSAVVKCPMTTDFAFARLALDQLSTDSVERGGTAIGDALRVAVTLLTASDPPNADPAALGRYRDIIMLTDGEDHETDPLAAAAEAGERQIRIITIGLGSELSGAEVPASEVEREAGASIAGSAGGQVMRYGSQRVQTRMNPATLAGIAGATPGGRFFNVGTGSIELDRVYGRLMKEAEQRTTTDTPSVKWTEAFQWPLGLAIVLLVAEAFGGSTWRLWRRDGSVGA